MEVAQLHYCAFKGLDLHVLYVVIPGVRLVADTILCMSIYNRALWLLLQETAGLGSVYVYAWINHIQELLSFKKSRHDKLLIIWKFSRVA